MMPILNMLLPFLYKEKKEIIYIKRIYRNRIQSEIEAYLSEENIKINIKTQDILLAFKEFT
tara:strand:+ start:370 stop:552 length:183 start_codon:yes stop_codon:yes gene_type:complete